MRFAVSLYCQSPERGIAVSPVISSVICSGLPSNPPAPPVSITRTAMTLLARLKRVGRKFVIALDIVAVRRADLNAIDVGCVVVVNRAEMQRGVFARCAVRAG